MNQLQEFIENGATQSRDVIQEAFTIVGESGSPVRYGTFGAPELVPVMTRNGYQDLLAVTLKAQASQFATPPAARSSIVRTATGRTFFVQMVDYTAVVTYTFILTDREV